MVPGDLAHRAERVFDNVGAGERAPEFVRQAEADDGEDRVQPLQDAANGAQSPHAQESFPSRRTVVPFAGAAPDLTGQPGLLLSAPLVPLHRHR